MTAGKQCAAMSHTAIIYHQIQDISSWTNYTLNNILVIGNNLYSAKRCSVRRNDYLLLTDVPDMVSIFVKVYSLQHSESFTGNLFMTSNIGPYMSLREYLHGGRTILAPCKLPSLGSSWYYGQKNKHGGGRVFTVFSYQRSTISSGVATGRF